MDRNTLTGLLLIFAIIAASVFLLKPSVEEIKKERELQAARNQVENVQVGDTTAAADAAPVVELDSMTLAGPFGTAIQGAERLIVLENELIKATISTLGGKIKSVELKNEETYEGNPLMLFEGDHNKFGLFFSSAGKNIITNDMYFHTDASDVVVRQADSTSVTFRLTHSPERYIDYIYSIKGESYELGFTILTKGMQDVIAPTESQMVLNVEKALFQKEKDITSERQRSTAYYRTQSGSVDNLSMGGDDNEEIKDRL